MNERFNFRVAIKQADGTYKRYKALCIGRDARGLYARCLIPHKENEFYLHDIVIDGENTILEQYTGLKDKNGSKLIFEGDVVKTKQYGKDIDNRINVNDYDTFVVKFHECSFCIENDSRRFRMHAETKLEIIGKVNEKE